MSGYRLNQAIVLSSLIIVAGLICFVLCVGAAVSLVENLHRDYGDFKLDIDSWKSWMKVSRCYVGTFGFGQDFYVRILLGLEELPGIQVDLSGDGSGETKNTGSSFGRGVSDFWIFSPLEYRENMMFAAQARKVDQPGHD